ncbi:hypothetical protein Thi970DRAFT_00733 [Thiorhodovibrio frisius]|uniref:Uncharacterized protein n=2 Tax=Thiorhodovibrio frisius TaxID=631362 RepID=H8YXA5_9GAMM|nr:hypothetical protein Thi970DRAFT_00733 [Thiorhodovibrio frisius]WPL22655.1 hypothetical protein Thiofri_02822 [Thiorhodovibrio frisius]
MRAQMKDKQSADRQRLLEGLLARSRYQSALQPMHDQVLRVACENHQIAALLDRLAADSESSPKSASRFKRRRKDLALIEDVFEWVFFASDGFVERAKGG